MNNQSTRSIRIEFDESKCIAAKSCVQTNPSVFGFDESRQKAMMKGSKNAGNEKRVLEKEFSEEEYQKVVDAASSCPVNAFKVMEASTNQVVVGNTLNQNLTKEIRAQYDDAKEFVLDPKGYFLIRVNYEKKEIEVGFCNAKNNLVLKAVGKKPIDIYHVIAQQNLGLRPEHYAYVGRELEKAFHCLQTNLEYVQDDELDRMKPRKGNAN